METKKIRCPKCQGILEVTNPKNMPSILITCPNPQCGARMRIDFQTGNTVLAETEKGDDLIGCLTFAGDRYPLAEGSNTVGRKAPTSAADIQIDCGDKAMSREHVRIQVVRLKNGRVKAILSDMRSPEKTAQQPVLVEDEPLFPGDAIVLANGDTITMGKTKLKYKKQT